MRIKIMKRYFIFLFLFFISASYATDFITLLSNVKTMQADFTQIVYDNHLKPIQEAHGKMALSRPGKFRWQVIKPIPQLIIANGSKLWIYDPDLEQVTIRPLSKSNNEAPGLLLSHENTFINKDFVIKKLKDKQDGLDWFELTPKNADSMFAEISMAFQNRVIKEMRLEDHLGHTTLVKFSATKSNQVISPSLFLFHAAKNVDVIDETKRK